MLDSRYCLNCGSALTVKHQHKFCSRSCAASYNLRGKPSHNGMKVASESKYQRKTKTCPHCGTFISKGATTCRNCKPRLMSYLSPAPYLNYLTNFPLITHDRYSVVYKRPDGTRSATSLARYLMSLHLGYVPSSLYDVDHIDMNPLNDRINNLQLILRVDNASKGGKSEQYRTCVQATCPVCYKVFTCNKVWLLGTDKIFTCSRSCGSALPKQRELHGTTTLQALNNAIAVQIPRRSRPIDNAVFINQPSPNLKVVLDILKQHGQDLYP